MATLRRDARALIDAVKASGSRVIERFEADDDGVCVSVTLTRGHTSNLTLIFEDGYPKGSFVAMSDDDRDETAIARLNAEVADRAGSLTLKNALTLIGRVFDCEEDARRVVEACIDAPGDDKVGDDDDAGRVAAAGGSDASTAGDDDDDDDHYAYSDEDDSDADGAKTGVDASVPGELNSDQLTRLYQNKRKCVEREERRVAQKTANEGANGGAGEETWDMKAAARNQIFSSKGAFTRLSTELFALQERMDPELAVDAVDHDVYVWDVKFMGGFDPGSGLAEDLETLEAVNGYGYVQLRLHFMADLYPFYPPRVELVRPKLAGIIPGAMTAHPRLHLRNWQPFRPIKSVVEHLRAFLQKFARVDLASELNEIERFPDGAYVDSVSRLELALARLAACGTSCGGPLIPSRYNEMYEEEIRLETESGATRRGYEEEFGRDDADIVDFARVLEDGAGGAAGGAAGGVGGKDGKGGKDGGGTPGSRDGKGAGPGPGSTGKIKLKSSSEAKADKRKEYWAKGTGYGHDTPRRAGKDDGDAGSQTWDAAAARGAQAAEDQSVLTLLVEATRFIEALPQNPSGKPGKTRKRVTNGGDDADAAPPTLTDAEASRADVLIRASSLPQFLARELKNCSFMNMTARFAYYSSLMRTARALAESRCADCLLIDGAAGQGHASALVKTLEDAAVQAKIYLKSVDECEVAALATATASLPSPSKESLGTLGSNDESGPNTARHGLKSPVMAKPGGVRSPVASSLLNVAEKEERRRAKQREAIASEVALARLILDAGESVSAAAHALGFASGASGGGGGGQGGVSTRGKGKGKGKGKKGGGGGGGGEGDDAAAAEEEAYQSALRPFTYDSAELLAAGHAYAGEARVDLRSGPHISRVAKEIAGLAGGALPLNRSSSAFVRVDDAKSVIWSIMITGPEDTPYDGGCFVFDAFFPSGYPTHAPKIQFKTTGGGRWRANPNLYKDGKVCLSLLGTWQGGKGETWDPAVSTMLQVIVSIQSLILCPRPYFNEPGFERLIGTPEGRSKSDQYDAAVVENTLRWAMIESLKKPHPAFKDVIRAHFRLRKGHLLGPVRARWTEGATGERKARLDGLFKELEAELKKL